MRWVILIRVFLIIVCIINSSAQNEIRVVHGSGDIARSLLELLAGGRLNVDENQSHLMSLRARLQDKPQHVSSSKFNGNMLNRIASNLDETVQINVDQSTHTTPTPKHSDELNFVEDTDEKNFVTEPYPSKNRPRNWINRQSIIITTPKPPSPPTTTQFTLFPTFPTIFPTMTFATFPPLNPFTFPPLPSTFPSVFQFQTTQAPTTTQITPTTVEDKKVDPSASFESRNDLDLLKPPKETSNHRSKIVGARLKFGEMMNKQEEDDTTIGQPQTTKSDQPENDEESGTTPNFNNSGSGSSPSTDDESGNSGSGNIGLSGSGNSGSGNIGLNGSGNNGSGNIGLSGSGNNGSGNIGLSGSGNNGSGNSGSGNIVDNGSASGSGNTPGDF